ncbi:MAG: hypothetical protein E6Q83_06745 [Thiothrix sp.]|nr:MAG: hypothetical protein E6Q83_06745 [Thiothrix sp.]
MSKLLLSSSLLALLLSSLAHADSYPIDQTFFNVGGPSKAPTTVAVTTPAMPEVKQEDPMPDPSLFTQVNNLSEQNIDNAVDIFGLGKRKAAENASTVASTTTTAADGTTVATSAQTNQTGMPDPSLFTNPGTPKEQTRDHPFKLF